MPDDVALRGASRYNTRHAGRCGEIAKRRHRRGKPSDALVAAAKLSGQRTHVPIIGSERVTNRAHSHDVVRSFYLFA
jgi:hypothetical protein